MSNLKFTVTAIGADVNAAVEALEGAISAIKFEPEKFSTETDPSIANDGCPTNSFQIQVETTEEDVTSLVYDPYAHMDDLPDERLQKYTEAMQSTDFNDIGW